MIYSKDFRYTKPYIIQNRQHLQKYQKENKGTENYISFFCKSFCEKTTIHGMNYLVRDDLKPFEKCIWAVLVSLAIIGTIFFSVQLSKRYSSNGLATIVESTVYPVFYINFPAITVCNNNRINWDRIDDAENEFVPGADPETVELFRNFVSRFDNFEFGNFDEFDDFINTSLDALDHLNLTAVADFMSFRCEEIFEEFCWWRNKYLRCCDIFVKQKSEFGFCYGFNSVVNAEGMKKEKENWNWPWRTSTAGDWSGLKADIHIADRVKIPDSEQQPGIILPWDYPWHNSGKGPQNGLIMTLRDDNDTTRRPQNNRLRGITEESEQYPYKSSSFGEWGGLRIPLAIAAESFRPENEHLVEQGIVVIVHYPYQWPSSGLFIPMGSASSVLLKPKLSYADEETRRMPPEVRECVFPDETEQPKYESLPGLKYLKQNCLSNCRQEYLLKYCNCTVEMFFPPANFTPCKASDYRCLAENDKIFNYEKMEEEEKYINSSGEGMVCTCLHECYSIDYQEEVLPFHLAKVENFSRKILLNVFYQHNTILKYRMNVVFGWQDLLVSFGGIAGLFLGSSLLSGVEVIYYLTIGLAVYLESIFHKKSTRNKKAKFTNANTPAKPKKVIKVKPSKILLGVRIPPTNTKNKF